MQSQPATRPPLPKEDQAASENLIIRWTEAGIARSARWRSESGVAPHKRIVVADEQMSADVAYRLACEGSAILWRGDFQNARQMLLAMARRVDQKSRRAQKAKTTKSHAQSGTLEPEAGAGRTEDILPTTQIFHLHRLAQSQRARTLGMLLLPLSGDYTIPLRRAPDLQRACVEALGPPGGDMAGDSLISMRELLGMIGAHEWRKKGVEVPALNGRIHPHYGVFAPVRGEYVNLVAEAPLPETAGTGNNTPPLAFDIGTGTGVLAAVLARRGVARVIATDRDPRALACARENIDRLKLSTQVSIVEADLFPEGTAPLIVCNPPWIPARPSSPIEGAIYDPESRMLRGFLSGLAEHLTPGGEGWLILSDIAEHLGLRSRETLLSLIEQNSLTVIEKLDIRPTHPRVSDSDDPLHAARAAEVTSLWRLKAR
ncbi:MAG: class I SAM-dependent methyltransferase [Usitatibacteraceae bacterium]